MPNEQFDEDDILDTLAVVQEMKGEGKTSDEITALLLDHGYDADDLGLAIAKAFGQVKSASVIARRMAIQGPPSLGVYSDYLHDVDKDDLSAHLKLVRKGRVIGQFDQENHHWFHEIVDGEPALIKLIMPKGWAAIENGKAIVVTNDGGQHDLVEVIVKLIEDNYGKSTRGFHAMLEEYFDFVTNGRSPRGICELDAQNLAFQDVYVEPRSIDVVRLEPDGVVFTLDFTVVGER